MDIHNHIVMQLLVYKRKSIIEIEQQTCLFQSAHDVLKADGRQDENAGVSRKAFSSKSRNQPFAIYVDDNQDSLPQPEEDPPVDHLEVDDDFDNHLPSLNEAVMRLPPIPQPSARVPEDKGQ